MSKNRIRQLRKARNLTVAQMAETLGISGPQLTRLETGQRGLSVSMAEKIAMQFGVAAQDVLGLEARMGDGLQQGFAEDVEAYTPGPREPLAAILKRHPTLFPYRIKGSPLDEMGFREGDILLIDISTAAVDKLKPLDAVIAQIYDPADLLKATTVLRQFVPPGLLITNSRTANGTPLSLAVDDVHIKGVVTDVYRSLSGPRDD